MTRPLAPLLLLALLALGAVVPAASAERPAASDARARDHHRRGQRLVAAGDYEAAKAEFAAGYAMSPRPAFLFNLGECARLAGDAESARSFYERFLASESSGELAATARRRLAALPLTDEPATAATSLDDDGRPGRQEARRSDLAPMPVALAATAPAPSRADAVARPDLVTPIAPARKPLWKRWPLWVGVGAAVVVTTVTLSSVMSSDGIECSSGCSQIDLARTR